MVNGNRRVAEHKTEVISVEVLSKQLSVAVSFRLRANSFPLSKQGRGAKGKGFLIIVKVW